MKVVISHPTSNGNNRAAVYGLHEASLLSEFNTSIAVFPDSALDRLGKIKSLSEIQRRRFDLDIRNHTRTFPWLEVGRLLASKTGFASLTQHEKGLFCLDSVYKNLDKKVAAQLKKSVNNGVDAVYAYEDGAAFSFQEAKRLGIQCLYDLPIGYWRAAHRLLEEEKDRWPQWISTLTGFDDSELKLARKDEELRLADRIFVATRFTAETLKDFPGTLAPIEIIPYGFPPVDEDRNYSIITSWKPLKLLFVGGLSQRKGIANMFAAVDALKNYVELTVVGLKSTDKCLALNEALDKHRWIPTLPHAEILQLMRQHDILLFPSLFEGSGLVINEAMSQGTPVITTERTAGPDLIEHGRNGWLVKAGSTTALQEVIEGVIAQPQLIAKVGKAAMETARQRSWNVYGAELASAILRHSFSK